MTTDKYSPPKYFQIRRKIVNSIQRGDLLPGSGAFSRVGAPCAGTVGAFSGVAPPAPAPSAPSAPAGVAATPTAAPSVPLAPIEVAEDPGAAGAALLLSPIVRRLLSENSLSGPRSLAPEKVAASHVRTSSASSIPAARWRLRLPQPPRPPRRRHPPRQLRHHLSPRRRPRPHRSHPRRRRRSRRLRPPHPCPWPRSEAPATRSCRSRTCGGGRPSTWCAPRPSPRTRSSPRKSTSKLSNVCARPGDRFKAEEGFTLTYLPFVARASVEAPRLPVAERVGDGRLPAGAPEVNLGIAVDLSHEGLIVPVVHRAEEVTLRGIARRIRDLAERARSRQLNADDIAGGTFSITNDGPFETYFTVPIINQPQVAILATDGIGRRPVVVTHPDGSESIAIHSTGVLGVSWDHRAVDGAYVCCSSAGGRPAGQPGLGRRALRAAVLRVRRLGTVPYHEADVLQHALAREAQDDYLLILEHPHTYTLGAHADPRHVLVDPASVGAVLARADRGGDVTYHGPGQLVAYPLVTVDEDPAAGPCHVHHLEQVVIDVLEISVSPVPGASRVIRASGSTRMDPSRARSPPSECAPCGSPRSPPHPARCGAQRHHRPRHVLPHRSLRHRRPGVTSLSAEGVDVTMDAVVETLTKRAIDRFGGGEVEYAGVVVGPAATAGAADERPLLRRLRQAGVGARGRVGSLAAQAVMGAGTGAHRQGLPDARGHRARSGSGHVCEEAGCPNIYECWADGTATFMINGERCTRACGFCQVDTRHPLPLSPDEPDRVAEAVARMGLAHAVVTCVARDDLRDGGAGAMAATIAAIRPATRPPVWRC